jgi:hypothetical protein
MTPQQIIAAIKNPATSAKTVATIRDNPASRKMIMDLIQSDTTAQPMKQALAAALAAVKATDINVGKQIEEPEPSGEEKIEDEPMSAAEMEKRRAAWMAKRKLA